MVVQGGEIIPIALTKPCLYFGVRLRVLVGEVMLVMPILILLGMGFKSLLIGATWWIVVHAMIRKATSDDVYRMEIAARGLMRPRRYQAHRLVANMGAEPKPTFLKGHIDLTGNM